MLFLLIISTYPVMLLAEPFTLALIKSEEGGAYQEFAAALSKELAGQDVVLSVLNVDAPVPASDLVISVGMRAAHAVAASQAPVVLKVLVPKSGFEKLLSARAGSKRTSAIYLDQPVERQLKLIAAALPDRRRIGVLYTVPGDELAQLRRHAVEYGLQIVEAQVGEKPLADALQSVLHESDVLLALPDSAVYNGVTLRNILLSSYRVGIPMIGLSPAYTRAGALYAISSNAVQIAHQAAGIVLRFRASNILPAAQYPQDFDVTVNEQVAHSMGIAIQTPLVLKREIQTSSKGGP